MNSSMTTSSPDAPKTLVSIMSRSAASASAWVVAMTTPFPAARPEALMTIGTGCLRTYSKAGAKARKVSEAAVGTL